MSLLDRHIESTEEEDLGAGKDLGGDLHGNEKSKKINLQITSLQ